MICFFSETAFLGMTLTMVRGPGHQLALAPRLATLIISDLLEIETALPEIATALPEIETDLPEVETDLPEIETDLPEVEILSYELENKYQPHEGPLFEL